MTDAQTYDTAGQSYDSHVLYDGGPYPIVYAPGRGMRFSGSMQMAVPFAISALGGVAAVMDPNQQLMDRIVQCVATDLGERLMSPEFGLSLSGSLFSPLQTETAVLLKAEVQQLLNTYEPGVEALKVEPSLDQDNGLLGIIITYQANTPSANGNVQAAFVAVGG